MGAKKLLESMNHFVPLLSSRMTVISRTLRQLQQVNDNPYYKSENVSKLINQIEDYMEQDINQIYYIMELVDQLEEQKHRTIIYLRYFEGKTAGEIATQIQFNERYVFTILREAIQKLDKILKDSVFEDDLQTISSH